jgi:hypothetical protein
LLFKCNLYSYSAGGYELVDCDPEVQVGALLEECNRTDNLSGFVRGARWGCTS